MLRLQSHLPLSANRCPFSNREDLHRDNVNTLGENVYLLTYISFQPVVALCSTWLYAETWTLTEYRRLTYSEVSRSSKTAHRRVSTLLIHAVTSITVVLFVARVLTVAHPVELFNDIVPHLTVTVRATRNEPSNPT